MTVVMDGKRREAFQKEVNAEPFASKMGMRLVTVNEGHAIVEMGLREDTLNILGMIHGGAIFSLIDEAFEISSNSHGTAAVALNMNVTFHQSPAPVGTLRAESREVHRTRKTATYEIRVTDGEEALIATCTALVYRKKEPLPFLDSDLS